MDNMYVQTPGFDSDRISPGGEDVTDHISAGDWNQEDAVQFMEEIVAPGRDGFSSSVTGDAAQPLMSRVASLAALLEAQRSATERTMVRAGRSFDPILQDKMARQMSEMYHNHELALKLISKMQQAIESVTKLQ